MACEEFRPAENFPFLSDGGFSFENYARNKILESDTKINGKLPGAFRTGTTIVGCIFDKGVLLGADTRATSDSIVDKNCEKIHYIAPNMYCCGAGTAADTEMTTAQISSQLELLRLNVGKEARIVTAMTMLKRHLFSYQGHVSAALVLGGVDCTGPHLWSIHPHGSCDKLPYLTMGSGSLAAMSVFESEYKDKMSEADAIKIVSKAVMAGILNDLGSGSNVDLCVIKAGSVDIKRNFMTPMNVAPLRAKIMKPKSFGNFPLGTTITQGKPVENIFSLVDVISEEMDIGE